MKQYVPSCLAIIIAMLMLAMFHPTPTHGQDAVPKKESIEKKPTRAARPLPFRGRLVSVNLKENTLTVGKRIFHIEETTRLRKGAEVASLKDGTPGDKVSGSYRKQADGTLQAVSIRFGEKPRKPTKPSQQPEPKKDTTP